VRRLVTTSIILLALGVWALPALAEVTQEELRAARAIVNELSADLEDEMQDLEAALLLKYQYEQQISELTDEITQRDREIALAAFAARDRAREMYVSAGADAFQTAAGPETITRLGTKTAYLDAVVDLDVDIVNELEYLQTDRAVLQEQIDRLAEEQAVLSAELEARTEEILGELGEANAAYQALYDQWRVEEAERQRKAAEARARARAAAAAAEAAATGYVSSAYVDPSGRTCPVAGAHSFTDTWGDPRTPNRTHKGTDLVAPEGTPLVSMENGYIWSPNWHWAGGNGLYIRGDSGDIYYYAHLQKYAPGVVDGLRVGVGQVIGYVGNTGNSTIPHLHLGYQPGGGPLTNPYQLLVKLCR
jgi:murein DD-endopeptidase MepM/ murein hydrolase activator NlpD